MRVTLPWPRPELFPNKKTHWTKMSRYKGQLRHQTGWAARSQGVYPIDADRLRLTITFCPPDLRKRDRDNIIAAWKAGQDGLSDAVGVDDAGFVPTYEMGEPVPGGAVVVVIHEDEEIQENKGMRLE